MEETTQPKTPIVGQVDLDGRKANVHALPFGLARKIAKMSAAKTDGYEIAELAIAHLVRYEDGTAPDIDELSTAAVQDAVNVALGEQSTDFPRTPRKSA